MKKLVVSLAAVFALLAVGSYFLLGTGAGLRWAINQALTRTGAPVEVAAVEGTLLGPLTLNQVHYRDPDSGAEARIEQLALDWRPGALFRGMLHVTRLRGSGIRYVPGTTAGTPREQPGVPDLSFPLAVQLDRLEVERVTVGEEQSATTVVDQASLRGSLDAEALVIEDIRVTAPGYAARQGRLRMTLSGDLPVDAAVAWRIEPEGMPTTTGNFQLGGHLRGTLEPALDFTTPFSARARGSVSDLLDAPQWQLAVEVPEPVALDSIVAQWPAVTVQGRLQSQGDRQQARLQPDISFVLREPEIAAAITGDARISREAVVVEQARITRRGTDEAVELSGQVAFDDALSWSLEAGIPQSVALNDIVPAWPALSVQGGIRGQGDGTRALLEPDLALVFEQVEAQLTGETEITKEAVVISRARLARAGTDETIDLSGRLGFADPLPWSLDARLPEPVALDQLMPGLPALSVQGRIQSRGDGSSATLEPSLSLAFEELAASLEGEAEITKEGLTVKQARLDQADSDGTLAFSGGLGFEGPRPFELRGEWQSLTAPGTSGWSSRRGEFEAEGNADALTASLSGTVTPPGENGDAPVSLEARASGLRDRPVVTATAEIPYFAFAGFSVNDLDADIDLREAGDGTSKIRITASSIDLGERRVTGLALQADGTLNQHEATLDGQVDDWTVSAGVAGSWGDDRWHGTLRRLDAESPQQLYGGPWKLDQPADVVWSREETDVEKLCLSFESARLCGGGQLAGAQWRTDMSVDALPLRWLAADTPEPMRVDGTVSAEASAGNRGSGIEGDAEARIDRASIDWQGEDPVETTYQDVVFTAALTERELRMKLDGQVDESGTIQGRITTAQPLAGDGDIQGSVSVDLPSLRVLQAAIPALGVRKGAARVELNVDGRRRSPRFSGEGRISDATVGVAALGIELTALQLDVRSQDQGRLTLEARADSGDGTLEAEGYIDWPDEGGWGGEIRVTGDEAELAHLPRALIDGSPDLTVTLDQGGGRVSGSVRLTRAKLTPESGRARITISEDIVVVGEEQSGQPTRNPMAWHIDVTIELGDQVTFNGYGVTGRLSGSLELNAPPRQPTRANGSIQIHDGEYSLYGRTFDIQRGRINYTGGPIDNPGIDVQVGRDAGEVTVTLSITGSLLDPALNLSANQAMSDTDKMSYLLLGRPASRASEAEAGLLLRAAASLLPGGGGGGVPAYVQSTLGLDTLELRTDSPDTEGEGASVELGKYLSPKLYVSYVAGFQQTVNVFRIRYELARHWLLRAESSTRESSGDLLFTW